MKKTLFALAATLFLLFLLFGKEKPSPEKLKLFFDNMKKAGESKRFSDFMEFFSLYYKDDKGITYIYLKKNIKHYFENYQSFKGSYKIISVSETYKDHQGNRLINITMDVTITGIRNEISTELMGTLRNPDRITLILRQEILGKWKIVNIKGIGNNETNKKIYGLKTVYNQKILNPLIFGKKTSQSFAKLRSSKLVNRLFLYLPYSLFGQIEYPTNLIKSIRTV